MSATSTDTFGQRVKKLRLKKGIRQVDLAEKAGISWRHLIRIEQDAGGTTKETTVAQLAQALDVDPSELTGDEDDEESDLLPDLDLALRSYLRRLIREEGQSAAVQA